MVEYILGNYLIEAGKIDKEQLAKVLNSCSLTSVNFETVAVDRKMLTSAQVEELKEFWDYDGSNLSDVAIAHEYLTDFQAKEITSICESRDVYFVFTQTLINLGFMGLDELDWLSDEFCKSNSYTRSELDDLKSDDMERIVPLLLPEEGLQYKELVCIALKTMTRMVDKHIYLKRAAIVDGFPNDLYASQAFECNGGMVDFFSERDGALLRVCSIFGCEEFTRLDAESIDSAGELLNCINGTYVAELSRDGEFKELKPPFYNECKESVKPGTICRIPIFVEDKGLYFTVAELN